MQGRLDGFAEHTEHLATYRDLGRRQPRECGLDRHLDRPRRRDIELAPASGESEQNPAAIKRLVAGGVQLRPFPDDVLTAALTATNELWAEISAKNAEFKKAIDAMTAYRSDQYLWWRVAEYTNDTFMIRSRTRG